MCYCLEQLYLGKNSNLQPQEACKNEIVIEHIIYLVQCKSKKVRNSIRRSHLKGKKDNRDIKVKLVVIGKNDFKNENK